MHLKFLKVFVLKKISKTLSPDEKRLWKNYTQTIDENYFNKVSDKVETNQNPFKSNINLKALKKRNLKNTSSAFDSILIDKKIFTKLKNGRLTPQRTLDLHGLTYDNAYSRVVSFINLSYQDGVRLILVITGKGRKTINNESFSNKTSSGVLKSAFPTWLKTESLFRLILNVTTAHSSHGGEGAYYVYLRKKL